ncbi:cytochrome P450 [Xylariaceae sp. FL0594]|nr:cytochrome P450 [Xylariaceae sp. FL0594]
MMTAADSMALGVSPWGTDNSVQVVAMICLIWLGWRLYSFTIYPTLCPDEPRVLPYWFPYIGHTWQFVRNPETLINYGFHYFGSDQPFTIVVAGQRTVIVRNVQDVSAMWRNTEALSIDQFVVTTLGAFGMSKATRKMIFTDPRDLVHGDARSVSLLINQNPQNKVYMDLEREWFTAGLLAPEALRSQQKKYHSYLRQSLAWDNLSPEFVIPSEVPNAWRTVSVARLCQYIVSYCSTRTFFGNKLLEVAPDFLRAYQEFERESWKIFYRLPPFLARNSHRAKNRGIDGLAKYLSLPEQERSDMDWIFRTITRELKFLGVNRRDIAAFVMVFIWAFNNNAHKVGFWILAHLLHDPPYMATVRSEIAAAYTAPDQEPDMDVLLKDCPHLDAMWYEAMRLYNATSAIREAKKPCTVGGKTIRVGDQLIAPFRQFHLNRSIFGDDASSFRPERFLENKSLPRKKGYAPFGGGYTYCPGRLFAQREIYLFIAEALWRFDMELVVGPEGMRMPEVDISTPSAAAMSPARDVIAKLKARVH